MALHGASAPKKPCTLARTIRVFERPLTSPRTPFAGSHQHEITTSTGETKTRGRNKTCTLPRTLAACRAFETRAFLAVEMKPQRVLHPAPPRDHIRRRDQKRLFPFIFDRTHIRLFAFAVGRGVKVACNDVCIVFLSFLSSPNSCFATSRLFAVVLLRCAETAVYVLFPYLGGLLNLGLSNKNFKPNESCFDVPRISPWIFAPPRTQKCFCETG